MLPGRQLPQSTTSTHKLKFSWVFWVLTWFSGGLVKRRGLLVYLYFKYLLIFVSTNFYFEQEWSDCIATHYIDWPHTVPPSSPYDHRGLRWLCSIRCEVTNQQLIKKTVPWPLYSAALGGATRLELCGNLGLGGGTTPSLGLFQAVREATLMAVSVAVSSKSDFKSATTALIRH
jgi:hypothetical protein